MSYFDHAKCISCGAQFDPEQVVPKGDGFSCPACGAQMALKDLFGLRAAFEEEAPPDVTLDDLVPGAPPPATPGRQAQAGTSNLPAKRQPPASRQAAPARQAPARQAPARQIGPARETALDVLKKLREDR